MPVRAAPQPALAKRELQPSSPPQPGSLQPDAPSRLPPQSRDGSAPAQAATRAKSVPRPALQALQRVQGPLPSNVQQTSRRCQPAGSSRTWVAKESFVTIFGTDIPAGQRRSRSGKKTGHFVGELVRVPLLVPHPGCPHNVIQIAIFRPPSK